MTHDYRTWKMIQTIWFALENLDIAGTRIVGFGCTSKNFRKMIIYFRVFITVVKNL